MKSGRQRREEIRRKRLERAKRIADGLQGGARRPAIGMAGVEPADTALLARHNHTVGPLPAFYVDNVFVCRDCGEEQVWTAKQQKWWHEVRQGSIFGTAVRCLPCRRARRAQHGQPGAHLLGERVARLRALGARRPDAAARAEVEAALADKWWGVRTVAIATLGAWGEDADILRLKALLAEHAEGGHWGSWGYEACRAVFKALAAYAHAPSADADIAAEWLLENCLGGDDAWPLQEGLRRQPPAFWEQAMTAEFRRGEDARLARLCALLAGVRVDPVRHARWRQRFASHPSSRVKAWLASTWPEPA